MPNAPAVRNDSHLDPKVLGYLQDTSSVTPHRDSGSARVLEKSGAIGKLNVSMYICLRLTIWNLTTLRGNLWALLNRSAAPTAGEPAIQASDRLPKVVPAKYDSGHNRDTPFMITNIPTAKSIVYYIIEAHLKGGPLRQLLQRYKKANKNPLNWFLKCDDIYFGGTDLSRIECPVEERRK